MKKIIKKALLIIMCILLVISMYSCEKEENSKDNDKKAEEKANDKKDENNKEEKSDENKEEKAENTEEKKDKDFPFDNADKKRVVAKGLYLTASSAASSKKQDDYIELANTTEINSYVVDFKNDQGKVYFDSKNETAKEIGATEPLYDKEDIKKFQDSGVYMIARIVCFKDPILAKEKPERAIKSPGGGLYIHNKMAWLNPYNKDNWQYNIDLAKEAIEAGFDEVQLDYIRFPDGKKSQMVFGNTDGYENLYDVINAYLKEARNQMPKAILSGDVFAIICESPEDTEGIGQYWEKIGENLDYICPMAYPSHYALGQKINGVAFPKPDLEPGKLIEQTFKKAIDRYSKVDGYTPKIRAYMQDFTASWIGKGNYQEYGAAQVREQIEGLKKAGIEEWFFWDFLNTYHEDAFKKN